jgi:hypothetical protein
MQISWFASSAKNGICLPGKFLVLLLITDSATAETIAREGNFNCCPFGCAGNYAWICGSYQVV